MAGWKTTDMLNGIDGVMNLAAASGENLALVSDIVTKVYWSVIKKLIAIKHWRKTGKIKRVLMI